MSTLADECVGGAVELALYELLRQRLTQAVLVPNPGAGNEITAKVPGGATWEVLGLRFTFAASAVVANRRPNMRILDGQGNVVYHFDANGVIAAGASNGVGYYAGLGTVEAVSQLLQPLPSPPAIALPGWSVVTNTVALDVGDTFTGVVLVMREWNASEVLAQAQWIADHAR